MRALRFLMLFVGVGLFATGCASAPSATTERAAMDSPSWQQIPCFDVSHLSDGEQVLANELMEEALDYQALYTLVGEIKPMSTLRQKRFFVARPDTVPAGSRAVVTTDTARASHEDAARLQRVAEALHCGSIETVVVPFRSTRSGIRTVQALLINRRGLDHVVERDLAFWGQWAFAPGVSPGVVTTTVEYEDSFDRFRGYGYLFGYPEHAVTFFVEAAQESDSTGVFVERDFFHIPTHQAQTNRFTYAVPEGYTPAAPDSAIYQAALDVLADYRDRRHAYVASDSTLHALELIRDWYREAPQVDPRRPNDDIPASADPRP